MKQKLIILPLFFLIVNCCKSQSWGDPIVKESKVFISAETPPRFPGGVRAFYKFLSDSLAAPDDEYAVFSTQQLTARIIIDTDGKVLFAEIVKGINPAYNKAALALVSKMPHWIPARQNGHPVRFSLLVPIISAGVDKMYGRVEPE